jgi:pimeloyl-ACP methyl ester carboxylesterase
VSVLNGAVGDYLAARQNGLAVDMHFVHQGRHLALTPTTILRAHPQPTAKLCILVHGLGCHEAIWTYPAPDRPEQNVSYGALLQEELGYTPFFLRYNTGLSIEENGRHFAGLVDELIASYPLQVEEIVLIGHSMGGLVIRHACHRAVQRRSAWVLKIAHIFYLGSPHEGAPLARLGRAATTALQAIPNPITQLIGDIFDRRSQGIKDLSAGTQIGSQTSPPQPGAQAPASQPMPWLPTAQHYLLAGAVTADPDHLASLLFGDGLVPIPKEARHATPSPGDAANEARRQALVKCFPKTHHMQLAYSPEVYAQLKTWCTTSRSEL